MKIVLKNLGPLVQAEFQLNELTVICGANNTGKTYATYGLFGFLDFWNKAFEIDIKAPVYEQIYEKGRVTIDLREFIEARNEMLETACKEYQKYLPMVFASHQELFRDSSFQVILDEPEVCPLPEYKKSLGVAKNEIFNLIKEEGSEKLEVEFLMDLQAGEITEHPIGSIIGGAVKEILYAHVLPVPFIASAERTGAAIFKKHLNFARNNLLEQMTTIERDADAFQAARDSFQYTAQEYAIAVRTDVEFNRNLDTIYKQRSEIIEQEPDILDLFAQIIGGAYEVDKNGETQYRPVRNKRLKLSMDESSSTVRSMLDIGFYLHHLAKKSDILMIDEPELNLHPENQRRFAVLINRMRKFGIRVFITTHSDYIIKEFNTLIMMSHDQPHIAKIREQAGYEPKDVLECDKVSVFIAEDELRVVDGQHRRKRVPTLTPAKIDPQYGIEARSFDTTIERMDRIQRALHFGRDEF